ncbi:venom protease [Leptinotarsa decemlineata]|uniref:venom protease n=1 Tax=Leptinotarsa decemlineata TaxID=7539 RepID=UPI003D309577
MFTVVQTIKMIKEILYMFLIVSFVHKSVSLKEGDFCKLADGSDGICTIITKCNSAKEALQEGILPKACDFIGTSIIACCKDSSPSIPASRIPAFPPPPPPQMITQSCPESTTPKKKVGIVAEKKCKEYAQFAYERRETDTLSIIRTYSNVLECAIDYNKLIVGGTTAGIKEFPHMALIGYQAHPKTPIEWYCGGSIISHNFVLTAAHCFYHNTYGSAKFVRVGITNKTDVSHMQQLEVEKLIHYPEYTGQNYQDIGLLKLVTEIQMNPYARAACLYTEKMIPNVLPIASGWGIMEETGNPTDSLMKVTLEIFPHKDCDKSYERIRNETFSVLNKGIVDDWMICAGSTTKIKDTCRGDSGGPLQIIRNDTKDIKCMYNIIGVTAFGKPCGIASNQPGVYTRVSHYIQWIEDNVWPNE